MGVTNEAGPEALVIDLDGVLAHTFEIHMLGWLGVMKSQGVPPERRLCADMKGIPTYAAMRKLMERCDVACSPELLEEMVQLKTRIRDDAIARLDASAVGEGVLEFLTLARSRG